MSRLLVLVFAVEAFVLELLLLLLLVAPERSLKWHLQGVMPL
jgi:hypothetical protein